jgi:hypothetical protein
LRLNYKYRLYPTPQRCCDARRVRIVEEVGSDAAHALRLLPRSPGFTATVALSLALGIGTNTAMYSLVKQVILDLLPLPNPAEIVWITKSSLHHPAPISSFSVPLLRDFQWARDLPFDGIAGADGISRLTMITGSSAEPVRGEIVTGNYFEVLGVRPALGRMFSLEDDKLAGAHPVAVLSYNFWKRRFAANPGVLNSIIRLNGYPFTIVGVSAARFDGLSPGYSPDIRVPLLMKEAITIDPSTPMLTSRDSSWIAFSDGCVEAPLRIRPPSHSRRCRRTTTGCSERRSRSMSCRPASRQTATAAGITGRCGCWLRWSRRCC